MNNYLKGGLKILGSYVITLLIFVVFLYAFLSIARDKFSYWLPIYSFVFFLLLFAIIYSDMRKLALKEKRPQYNLNPYPLKGLVYGFIGFLPVIILELIYPLIALDNNVLIRIKELILKTLMGPLYFIIKLGGGTTIAYIIASLIIPAISMLAYMAGYYGFELGKYFKKTPQGLSKEFTKSPWNPSAGSKKNVKSPLVDGRKKN